MLLLVSFVLLLLCMRATSLQFETTPSDTLLQGKTHYESLAVKHSPCWKAALQELASSCRSMTDDDKRKLALALNNCHLEASGRERSLCTAEMSVLECTQGLPDTNFVTYTQFFNHADSICYYLQSSLWQQQTEHTINRLSSTADGVSEKLDQSLMANRQLLNGQQMSLENQRAILSNGESLNAHISLANDKLSSFQSDVHDAFSEVRLKVEEQQLHFAGVMQELFGSVEKVRELQQYLLGEFFDIQAVMFYVCSVLLGYLLTGTVKTQTARVWIFSALTLNFIVERMLISNVASDHTVVTNLWLCRKIFCLVGALTLCLSVILHKDYMKLNHGLLRELSTDLRTVQQRLSDISPAKSDLNVEQLSFRKELDIDSGSDSCDEDFTVHSLSESEEESEAESEPAPNRTPTPYNLRRQTRTPSHSVNASFAWSPEEPLTPVAWHHAPTAMSSKGYHLRPRSSAHVTNPLLWFETAKDFAKVVQYHLAYTLFQQDRVDSDVDLTSSECSDLEVE
eukprot:GILJ01006550.1.p1 GENE.GILJ01006550.1~~GILJ01006550.1.p1  ORF type:complete len:525 (-),score=79.49 GILJ01006550.1:180-1712(-)